VHADSGEATEIAQEQHHFISHYPPSSIEALTGFFLFAFLFTLVLG
jgi:hypothetical protein